MKAHPMAGLARINLTFRRLDPQTAARAPACKCGQKAVLKVWPCWAGTSGLALHAVQMLDNLCKHRTDCLPKQASVGSLFLYRLTALLLYTSQPCRMSYG